MKAEKIKIWGVCPSDGSGYGLGVEKVISWYPIKAAADGSPENIARGGYSYVGAYDAIRFDELLYIFEKEIPKTHVIGNLPPAYTVGEVYVDYIYSNGYDGSQYYIGDKELLALLKDGKSHSIKKRFILRDGEDNCFILAKQEPIQLNKFIMSRELAVAHALSKLTDEEKSILGLK